MWRWIGRIALVAIAYFAAEAYSSSTVRERITEFRETLIAPDGRRVAVARTEAEAQRPGVGRILSREAVQFGYRVTYETPTRPRLVCTYRLPGISCEDGWTVVWRPR